MPDTNRCPNCGGVLPADSPGGLCPQCEMRPVPVGESQADPARAPTLRQPPHSLSAFVAPTPEELATRFPQLEILELLGTGGMGAVYKARQPGLDRLVAVKILPQEVETDAAFAQRFTREARALAKLNHPNIVGIHDFGRSAGQYYFVMEFVDGPNLRQMIAGGTLTPRDALAIVPQICEALQFAHDEGIVHRDIKPANILIDKRGRVKIADFGLAKLLGHEHSEQMLTAAHQVMGTLRYMAPEQMQGSCEVDHRADIYSLGVVFYEMLTGELPIGRFTPPSHKAPMDVRLDEVVLRSLEAEPDRRYQHASDVKTDVDSIRDDGNAPPPIRVGAKPPGRQISETAFRNPDARESARRHVRAPAIALICVAIMNCIIIVVFLSSALLSGRPFPPYNSFAMAAGIGAVLFCLGAFTIVWALRMRRLELYPLALVAAAATMLCSPVMAFGIPCGIWALIVLLRADVRAAFADNRSNGRLGNISDPPPRLGKPAAASQWPATQDGPVAGAINVEPVTRPPSAADPELVKRQVRPASIGLIASGVINIAFVCYIVLGIKTGHLRRNLNLDTKPLIALSTSSALAVGLLSIFGGIKMRRLETHRLAVLATYAAMLPLTPGFVLVPCVIWTRVVLGRNTVLAAFEVNRGKREIRNSTATANESARRYTRGPAACLICAAIVNGIFSLVIVVVLMIWEVKDLPNPASLRQEAMPILMALMASLCFIIGVLTFIGALHLWSVQLFPLVVVATVAAMLPVTPGFLIGLPCGIWALAVLRHPEVRAAFESDSRASPSPPPSALQL